MTTLEQAAIDFYDFLYQRVGDTADFPIHLTADNDADYTELIARLNAIADAVIALRHDINT